MTDRWERVLLGAVTTKLGSGATPRGGSRIYTSTGTAFIRSQNVYDHHFEAQGLAFIDDTAATALSAVTLQAGDVLLNITGDSVARCCVAPTAVLPARVSQHVMIVRPDPARLNSRFLEACLVQPRMKQHLLTLAGAGATRPALTKAQVAALEIPLPPLSVQTSIAGVLRAIDEKIECNESKARLLYEVLQSTWQRSAGSAAEVIAFSDIANIDKGVSYKGSYLGAGAPLVNLANFGVDGRFHADTLKYYSGESRDRHWVRRGSLVLANTDLTQRREILGQPGLVDIEEERALFSHHVYAVRLNAGDHNDSLMLWLYGALREASFRDRAMTYATGTTVAALPRDALLTYELPWPDVSERRRWGSIAQKLIDAAGAANRESRALIRMRDALLPRLLSGELRIREAVTQAGECL